MDDFDDLFVGDTWYAEIHPYDAPEFGYAHLYDELNLCFDSEDDECELDSKWKEVGF